MKKISVSTSSIPYSDNVQEWIDVNVKHPEHNCFFYAGVLAALDSTFILKKGKPAHPRTGETAHFYLEDKDGNVIDPTSSQLKKPYKYKGETVDIMRNLYPLIQDPLFRTLHKADRKRIIGLMPGEK